MKRKRQRYLKLMGSTSVDTSEYNFSSYCLIGREIHSGELYLGRTYL